MVSGTEMTTNIHQLASTMSFLEEPGEVLVSTKDVEKKFFHSSVG
jgi:hypothetical protein